MRLHVKIKALVLVAVLTLGGGLLIHGASAASTGNIYVSLPSSSVAVGGTVTVGVRINPGTSVTYVQFTLTYDTAKLQYQSADTSASAFPVQILKTASGATITEQLGSSSQASAVGSDSLISYITFKALTGSGTTGLTLSNSNAAYNGSYTNPTTTGATLSLTTPACPSGQTGTYPNCVTPTPPSNGSGSGSGSGSSGGGSSSTKTTPKKTTPTGTTTTPTSTTKVTVDAGTPKAQFTTADLSVQTNQPTQTYAEYGVSNQKLDLQTPLSSLGTTHTVTFDPTLLVPATTYFYDVVTKDQQGNITKTEVQSFTTKGYTLHVTVVDKKKQPIKNAEITLHSSPITVKSDGKGVATFTNVASGVHHIAYTDNGKQYSQEITVLNNVVTDDNGIQTAADQNFSINLPVGPHQSPLVPILVILILAILVAAVIVFRSRLLAIVKSRRHAAAAPVEASPTVVSPSVVTPTPATPVIPSQPTPTSPPTPAPTPTPAATPPTPTPPAAPGQPSMTERLSKVPDPTTPDPGTLIRPEDDKYPKE